tara:strand:- start:3362 stop:5158 length:1797 start_codon:yes stop_codon:yes gene_type:complete
MPEENKEELESTQLESVENSTEEKQEKKVTEINYNSLSIEELIEEHEQLLETEKPYSVSKQIDEIKVCFYKKLHSLNNSEKESEEEETETDSEKQEKTLHPLEIKFKQVHNKYRKLKSEFRKNREKEEEKNLKIKQQIIVDIDLLIKEEESIKTTFEKFRTLQNKWKNTGNVPLKENNNLWQSYHHHVEIFYDYIKINNDLRDLDFKRNLEQKTLICEKSEKLLTEKSINSAFDTLQELHEHWKNIGPVVRELREEIWNRFQVASREINKKKNDYFHKKQAIRKNNLKIKSEICKQIIGLSTPLADNHNQWVKLTEELKVLSEKWKKAAPIEKEDLKKSWSEFREINNEFFQNKSAFYKNKKEAISTNLQIKVSICEKAEALSNSTQWNDTGKILIKLQEQWKNSPFVPNNISSNIWKRFRKACDTFFNARKSHYKKLDLEKEVNLKEKEAVLKKVNLFSVSDDAKKDIVNLKEFSKQWNSIGFIARDSMKINDEFNKLISTLYNKLKIDKSEKENIQFLAKTESLKGNKHQLDKEKDFIRKQIESVNKVISQYENNISFFGYGKGTESMKLEVMKKIDNSKKEIETLKDKLSTLNKI